MHKKTKIVATIGPKTEDEKTLEKIIKAGVNVLRLNFSHGDHEEHLRKLERGRKLSQKLDQSVAILQDLSGPKIRIGEFYKERVILKKGSRFTLTTKKIVGDETRAFVTYPTLPKELKKGDTVLLDDGKKELRVTQTTKDAVITKVIVGGETKGRRGVNLPGANLKISALTKKDKRDLKFGIEHEVDFFALSFVRRPSDVKELRTKLTRAQSAAKIISKIETQEAIEHIDEIIAVSDGIMVARGDLAIEVPAQKVPLLQKQIIQKCNAQGKPVITATQMLESMIENSVPTRAEVNDVANAILDGTDAVMLSEETTLGRYPVEAVKVMSRVAHEVENRQEKTLAFNGIHHVTPTTDSLTASVVNVSHEVCAKMVVAFTKTGFTAQMISRHKPRPFILGVSESQKTYNQLALVWGCIPVHISHIETLEEGIAKIKAYGGRKKLLKKDDKIVIAGSFPYAKTERKTNVLLVEEIGR